MDARLACHHGGVGALASIQRSHSANRDDVRCRGAGAHRVRG